MKPQLSLIAVGLCLAAAGCQAEEPWELAESTTSSIEWRQYAYPTLMRDCAFFACHGSSDRLFQIWGPKRHRLYEGELSDADDRTRMGAEVQKTYDMAIGFVDINNPGNSLLLRKGLDAQAGGTGHLGIDKYGRNVYRSASSPGYVALAKWVYSLRPKPDGEF
ncbi:MAG TPA: hypothetical protein VFN67_21190 [Polyangiales bacterium]|nr:hypothetical protein [Polyangiales bacterium]